MEGLPLTACAALQVGAVVLLVLGPTWRSGTNHEAMIDRVASAAGLTCIHPATGVPKLTQQVVDTNTISTLFTSDPFTPGTQLALLPLAFREMLETLATPPPV
jgi:hypothetical protein